MCHWLRLHPLRSAETSEIPNIIQCYRHGDNRNPWPYICLRQLQALGSYVESWAVSLLNVRPYKINITIKG